MSEQQHPESLAEVQARVERDFREMVERVLSGASPGFVFMTFGEGGKTLLTGDPGTLIMALETAKLNLVQWHIAQSAHAAGLAAAFSGPTAGSC